MGIAFKDLFNAEEISIESLKNKILIIDAYNLLYQFLTTIRARDGSLLTDSKGKVTSHLVGLFSRISKFLEKRIKLVFVFDGDPPKLKKKESQRRKDIKIEAQKKYDEALKKQDLDEMKKQASRTSRLTKEMVKEAKRLVEAFGIPVVQAPSEGEAQAAYMIEKGEGYAVVSQDFDSLVHGATKVVRNLSITGKRKKASKLQYETVKPEKIDLKENLEKLDINKDQLIVLGILVGTDYNQGGIKGIGPKNALKLVKQHGSDFETLFEEVKWKEYFEYGWKDVFSVFKAMPKTDNYDLKWKDINIMTIKALLVDEHDFSEERVDKTLENLSKIKEEKKQTGLNDFF